MRKKIVAGNWKMNKTLSETKILIKELKKELKKINLKDNTRVIIAPAYVNLHHAAKKTKSHKIEVVAQNMHQASSGAFTGEISADMLLDIGVQGTILGHSERREYFGEIDAFLIEKVNTALANKIEVIFCVGELLEDREKENHFKVVKAQVEKVLFHLEADAFENIVIAYEPIWAVGTGKTATAEQAQEMHKFIRGLVAEKYGSQVADDLSILYGGSVKPHNAKEIFSNPDVDGGLIGGAALKAKDFTDIVKAIQ